MRLFLLPFKFVLSICISLLLLTTSIWQPATPEETVRLYTRPYEFDFFSWTIYALSDKLSMAGLGFDHYLNFYQERKIIQDYFKLLSEKEEIENSIETIFSDPKVENPEQETYALQKDLTTLESNYVKQSSLAEVVIQDQISRTLDEMGLTEINQPFPPVLYHVTDLPKELIISPRDKIKQSASISLQTDINLENIIELEDSVEANSDYSALVVSIGGISTYPTMVINTSNLAYLLETIAHEWMHNYLVFRPLGINYNSSPELRTMNETTATIAGEEISAAVSKRYYRDLLKIQDTPYKTFEASYRKTGFDEVIEDFNFNQAMYQTRIRVDELLAQGQVEEAEDYMEEQRQIFWEQGYKIRRLNQAYFAFHGAYADQPYSAAGEDPVGEAVRTIRSRSNSLSEFIQKMSALSTYEELYILVNSF